MRSSTSKLWKDSTLLTLGFLKTGALFKSGMFGFYQTADQDSRANYARVVRIEAEKRGMSWAYWHFANALGIYSPRKGDLSPHMLDALTD